MFDARKQAQVTLPAHHLQTIITLSNDDTTDGLGVHTQNLEDLDLNFRDSDLRRDLNLLGPTGGHVLIMDSPNSCKLSFPFGLSAN
jgi:hypothetical protein